MVARAAGGQVAPQQFAAQELTAAAGFAESGRLDETASPLRFGGRGADFSLTYERSAARYTFVASLDGGTRSLLSLDGSNAAPDRLSEGELDLALMHAIGTALSGERSSTRAFAIGAELSALASMDEHAYIDPGAVHSAYLFAALSLGPAARWEHDFAGGRIAANLAIPLLALVDHPYSDIRAQSAPVDLRLVSLSSYRGLNGGLSFTNPLTQRLGVVCAYRVGVLHFDDEQPLHTVTQSLSIGIVRRIGHDAR